MKKYEKETLKMIIGLVLRAILTVAAVAGIMGGSVLFWYKGTSLDALHLIAIFIPVAVAISAIVVVAAIENSKAFIKKRTRRIKLVRHIERSSSKINAA